MELTQEDLALLVRVVALMEIAVLTDLVDDPLVDKLTKEMRLQGRLTHETPSRLDVARALAALGHRLRDLEAG